MSDILTQQPTQPHRQHDAPQQEDHAHPDHDEIPTDLPKIHTGWVIVAAIIALAAFGGLFAIGWFPRADRIAKLDAETESADAPPTVDVMLPTRESKPFDLFVPANVRAFQETSIFPRTSGYLGKQYVDIGQHVEAGQLLAEIEAPEVDADLNQAKATVDQAKANYAKAQNDFDLAERTRERFAGLTKTGGVTVQELDEKTAASGQAKAAMNAAKASELVSEAAVQRLQATQSFEKVYAPFDGVIMTRNYDVGALLSPTNTGDGKELFRVVQSDTLRIFVNVGQQYINSVTTGQQVFVSVPNYPGREFEGVVARSTGALDPQARTLRYEVDVPNKEGALKAGMYGTARILVKPAEPPMMVPTSAVVFDSKGTRVWVVEDNKVKSKPIEVGRDYGTELEARSGLSGNESVVTNPGERLAEGVDVSVVNKAVADKTEAPKPKSEQASAK
jgi:RND family efflux transporter MFP subunit